MNQWINDTGMGFEDEEKRQRSRSKEQNQQIIQPLDILPEMWEKGKNKQENAYPNLEEEIQCTVCYWAIKSFHLEQKSVGSMEEETG